jgi:hypothetical protein
MKRVATVVLLALVAAAMSGIHDTSWARQPQVDQPRDPHRRAIAAYLATIPLGSALEINPVRGNKFQALLEEIAPDAITVRLATGDYSVSRVIAIDEIKDLKRIAKIGTHTRRTVLVVVGIGAAVLVGTCAHAISSLDLSQSVAGAGGDGRP